MLHLLDQSPEQLQAWFSARGLPAYRASQVRKWLFEKCAGSLDEMTDLPKVLREQLAAEFQLWTTRIAAHHKTDDGTEKLLLELSDAQRIECVLLRDDRGHCAMCISTQVGCAMGCAFCASGLDGLVRNLTTGEIVEQMLQLQRLLGRSRLPSGTSDPARRAEPTTGPARQAGPTGERLSHVVVMGMGEPLANLERLMPALALATAPDGLGISVRRVTISTVGLPAGIRRLADEDCQYHLAVSLHAADDELRNRLMPANRKIGIAAVLAAADDYFEKTGRRVTYEYALLADENDRAEDAQRLAALLRGRPALVNLIPYNAVPGLDFRTPSRAAVSQFVEILNRGGLNVHIRRRKGDRINAACGQLRRGTAVSAETLGPEQGWIERAEDG